jgi:ribonuclease Z
VTYLVQPRLVNEAFSDPSLFLDFRFGRRALLFDIGDLTPLAPREIARVTHVFVSHMHMDHFAGFDRLLRLKLHQTDTIHFTGPPGLGDAVDAKLRAYTWNLLDEGSADFAIVAFEWSQEGFGQGFIFRARDAFRRREADPPLYSSPDLLHEEEEFCVGGAMLDHGIPSLAFAFEEKLRVNVHKTTLDDLGLPVGPWLKLAKRAMRRGDAVETSIAASEQQAVTLRQLLEAGALRTGRGQRIVYATDLAFHATNFAQVVRLALGADRLFIEAAFLDEDRAIAASKRHLTAAQAGTIARAAGVKHATPMHFSPRYVGRESALRSEFESSVSGLDDRQDALPASGPKG